MKRLIPVFVVFLMILIGCDSNMLESLGDDSSREANLEEAQMALDDGNYDEAISILEPGYNPNAPDPVVARVLASAYMGKAGIDLTYLIENAGNSGSDGGAFDTIASALSVDVIIEDDQRYLSGVDCDAMISSLDTANVYLDDLMDTGYGTGADKVQRGMVSSLHFIMKLGDIAADTSGSTDIPINKAAYVASFPLSNLSALETAIDDPANTTSLNNDMANVSEAVTQLNRADPTSDIAQDFKAFRDDITDDASEVTGDSVKTYIETEFLG